MRLKECALAIEGDMTKVLKLSKLLDVIAETRPHLEGLCLAVAKFLNAIAHQHHIRQSRELLELTLATTTDADLAELFTQKLNAAKVKEAQLYAAKMRARRELEEGF